MSPKHIPTIVAIGGHGFGPSAEGRAFEPWLLSLARKRSPRVCFLPTASGDADSYIVNFYDTFASLPCRPTHLKLFKRAVVDLRAFLLAQDVIYVGGGNTANMLAIWRAHGVDGILQDAWRAGVVLAGTSAGGLCWFDSGLTDSFGSLDMLGGLGFLPQSFCPHIDDESKRIGVYRRMVAKGEVSKGLAATRSAALRFENLDLVESVGVGTDAGAWKVESHKSGARRTRLPVRLLEPSP